MAQINYVDKARHKKELAEKDDFRDYLKWTQIKNVDAFRTAIN